jgi:hypothetical protein
MVCFIRRVETMAIDIAGIYRADQNIPDGGEAKQFAKAMLSDGIKIMVGTLQPHQPTRRMVGSSEINQWIEEEECDEPA